MGRKPSGGVVAERALAVQDLAGEQRCLMIRREVAD